MRRPTANALLRLVRDLGNRLPAHRRVRRQRVRSVPSMHTIECLEDRCLLSSVEVIDGVLDINANNGTGTNTIIMDQDTTNPALIDVTVNGQAGSPVPSFNPATITQVQVSTTVPANVATDNQLELSLGTYSAEAYTATAAGAGTVVAQVAGQTTPLLTITYSGIDAVFDATTAPTATFTDSTSDTALTIGGNPTEVNGAEVYESIRGTVLVPSAGTPVSAGRQVTQALVEVSNKASLTIDAGTIPAVNINSTVQPDGEQQRTIVTDAPNGNVTVQASQAVSTTISTNAPVSNTVTVGGPSATGLQGDVTLTNVAGSATTLVADESFETGFTNISFSDTQIVFVSPGVVGPSGIPISPGLLIANINYTTAGVKALTINGSSGGNNVTVTTTGAQTNTTLNAGSGNDTVTIDDAPGPLTVNMGASTNVVDVDLAEANTYDLSINGGGPAKNNTLDVSDPTRAPILTLATSGSDSGAVGVRYLLSVSFAGTIAIPHFKTYDIPYTDVANVVLLPDAEHSLVQALYQDVLQQTATLDQLTPLVNLLQKTGKIQSVVTKLEDSPAARKLAKHRPKIVFNQLPDFAAVEAELAASKPTRKRH